MSIRDLADRIVKAAGSTSSVKLISYEDAYDVGFEDMRRRVPDTTKMRELTGWVPRHSLDDILEATIAEALAEQKEHV